MRLEGIHHVTAITGDAPGNVDFYVRVLGLRLVKKTVNQDDPTVYHLFYCRRARIGRLRHHVLRVPGRAARARGRGHGAPRRLPGRVRGGARLLGGAPAARKASRSRARDGSLTFTDPEGLGLELAVVETDDEPLTAENPEIPAEHRDPGLRPRARLHARPRGEPLVPGGGARVRAERRRRLRGARRAARRALRVRHDRRRRESPARAPSTTSPGPRRPRSTRPGASASIEGGGRPTPGDRPLLLQVDLLPRAERRPVRDRDDRPRLHDRRAARDPRRAPLAPAGLRAPPRAGRARADADHEPAGQLGARAEPRVESPPGRGRAGRRARPLPRARDGRERPLPAPRCARPGAAPARRHAARAALAAARRPALVRPRRARLPAARTRSCPRSGRRRSSSTGSPPRPGSRPSEPCSAASRRAR